MLAPLITIALLYGICPELTNIPHKTIIVNYFFKTRLLHVPVSQQRPAGGRPGIPGI